MVDGLENPYLVLGLERTADERAVKKAYVALIRKFPPESAPEDFARIRAAYELLSDAQARARYDASSKGYAEYGENVGQKLKEIDEALSANKEALALEMLTYLAQQNPDAAVVQEKLGFLHLQGKRNAAALKCFEGLAEKEPENARHHMHRALALARLGKVPETENALRMAHRLAPKDTGISLNLVNFLIAHDKTALAIGVVDEVLGTLEPKSPMLYVLLLRKIEAHACFGDPLAHKVISELVRKVAESDDAELGPFASSQLASIAAKLFARKSPTEANALLERCRELNADSSIDRPIPIETSARPEDFPPAFTEWLESAGKRATPFTLRHATWGMPVLTLLAASVLLLGAAALASRPAPHWGAAEIVGSLFVLSLGGAAMAFAVRGILEILASPMRSFSTLHPLYFVRVKPDKITLNSLLHLTDVKGVHQHTNGVYTGTSITLTIGDRSARGNFKLVSLRVRGKDAAQKWLDSLIGVRGRSLELMVEGALEAEQLVDALPPKKLVGLKRSPWRFSRGAQITAGVGLAMGVVLTPLAGQRSVHDGDDQAFGQAAAKGTRESYREYLSLLPNGRNAARARAAASSELDRAIVRLKENVDEKSPGGAALVAAVTRLRDVDGRFGVHAVVEGPGLFGSAATGETLTQYLVNVLGGVGLAGLVEPNAEKGPSVTVHFRCTASSCAVVVSIADEHGTSLFESTQDAHARADVRLAARLGGGADASARAARAVSAEVFRDAMHTAVAALGIARPAPELALGAEESPYRP